MKPTPTPIMVVKLGGSVLSGLPPCWWDDLARLTRRRRLILVHGWSHQVVARPGLRQEAPVFLVNQHGHRSRVTDDAVIREIRTVASGLRELLSRRLTDRGLSVRAVDGADAGLLEADVVAQRWWVDGELRAMENLVGAVCHVDATAVGRLLGDGAVLVVTPLARSPRHQYVNVDADRAAAAIAVAMQAVGLALVTDVPGLLVGAGVLPTLRAADIPGLACHIKAGMAKKVRAGATAAQGGVAPVVIGDGAVSDLLAGRTGTRMLA
jgi:[amino group carrier protein]-L-2-aminoadipate 6-kinase